MVGDKEAILPPFKLSMKKDFGKFSLTPTVSCLLCLALNDLNVSMCI